VTEAGAVGTASSGASPVRIFELVEVLMPGPYRDYTAVLRRVCPRGVTLRPQQLRLCKTKARDCGRG
jgi:hypothetical protein